MSATATGERPCREDSTSPMTHLLSLLSHRLFTSLSLSLSLPASMASTVPILSSQIRNSSIKQLTESYNFTSVPSNYIIPATSLETTTSDAIPTIDFSLLTSASHHQRSLIIDDLRNACRDWGFFQVINHGVPHKLMEEMMRVFRAFFDLTEDEKRECGGTHVLDPIRYGTSFNVAVDKVMYWRDFLKVFVHPHFHSPEKPSDFNEVSLEYCRKVREMVKELVGGISESLGLKKWYIDETLEVAEKGQQVLIGNFYPVCPEPELALGLPPHSDHGLVTVLMQNQVAGLHLMHQGKWVQPSPPPPFSFLLNIGDHMEILSNGRYKSVLHRAVVNQTSTRMSIAMTYGPCLDVVVAPAPPLVDADGRLPAYQGMKYRDYLEFQQSNHLDGKSCLDLVRL